MNNTTKIAICTAVVLAAVTVSAINRRDTIDDLINQFIEEQIINRIIEEQMRSKQLFRDPFSDGWPFNDIFGNEPTTSQNEEQEPGEKIIRRQWIIIPEESRDSRIKYNNGNRQPIEIKKEAENKVTFKDVHGQDAVITEVREVVDFLKNPAKFHKLGAVIPKGILFEGPPGCGKTLLARAVANEAGCTFFDVSGSDFINKYVGMGSSNIAKLFAKARSEAPAIIFIDELDAIGKRTSDGRGNEEYHHTINKLLSEMDGFKQENNIVVIAATNHKDSLDKALLRPGRFDRIVKVDLPSKKGREDILRYYAGKVAIDKKQISPDMISKEFADRTQGFSGADLRKLLNEAALFACRENAQVISKKHLELSYDKVTLGLSNSFDRNKEQLKRTAYHEAGHTLVKVLTNQPVAKVSILSRGDSLGVTFGKLKYETASEYIKEELVQLMMGLHGGYLAEKIAFKNTTPGASRDIEQVNEIARDMVRKFGMDNGELEGLRYSSDMSETWKTKFDKAAAKLIEESRNRAEKLLTDNKATLDKLANELLKKETLSSEEITNITRIPAATAAH